MGEKINWLSWCRLNNVESHLLKRKGVAAYSGSGREIEKGQKKERRDRMLLKTNIEKCRF
jgi:hypothetical protein